MCKAFHVVTCLTLITNKSKSLNPQRCDQILFLSYYNLSSQSGAINDESLKFKVHLFDKTLEKSRSHKSSGGPEEQGVCLQHLNVEGEEKNIVSKEMENYKE
ncbi:hypothetical protein VP01_1675g2 [Puccinia sorghi]|uniref:Uncharacterized protein n=1 Tax=Puccinia sorghi TaxID=27349 RepID=A0A0L6VG13_9BASI|nr:hypothetical protein VP01_1675g2 [Puccinia sorghi]